MTSILEILLMILSIVKWIVLVHIILSWLINFQVLNLRQPVVAQIWFGLNQLLELAHHGQGRPQMLPTGLTLWMQVQLDEASSQVEEVLPAIEALPPPAEAPSEAPSSLGEASRELIEQALARCQGNISQAARMLGVSRGLLYRRLREWGRA